MEERKVREQRQTSMVSWARRLSSWRDGSLCVHKQQGPKAPAPGAMRNGGMEGCRWRSPWLEMDSHTGKACCGHLFPLSSFLSWDSQRRAWENIISLEKSERGPLWWEAVGRERERKERVGRGEEKEIRKKATMRKPKEKNRTAFLFTTVVSGQVNRELMLATSNGCIVTRILQMHWILQCIWVFFFLLILFFSVLLAQDFPSVPVGWSSSSSTNKIISFEREKEIESNWEKLYQQ